MKINIDLVSNIATLILTGIGIVVAIRKTYILVRKWRQKQKAKRASLFKGYWNNQGQIRNRPTHYADLQIWGFNNDFEGRYNVTNSSDENSWEMFSLVGKRSSKELKCEIFKVQSGLKILVATGILKRIDGVLQWRLKESFTDKFPDIAILEKSFPPLI